MLACSVCGWKGVNLVPSPEDDTSRCPGCRTVFIGIPAKDAVRVSGEDERRIVKGSDLMFAFCELLSPSKPR